MSYSIYYERAFIRIGDKFIPLVSCGSNNCWERINGRDVPEKNWNVMNWQRENQFLFTAPELRELARIYDEYNQSSRMIYKTRYKCFEQGELERWIMNGINRAFTVEEYISFGNDFYVLDYSSEKTKDWKRHPFSTTDELLKILDALNDVKRKEIKIKNNREVFRPVAHRNPKKKLNPAELPEYYVLKAVHDGQKVYFTKLLKRSIHFAYVTNSCIRVFAKEEGALKYLKRNQNRLQNERIFFAPERIVNIGKS
jgi:hypothetical protein